MRIVNPNQLRYLLLALHRRIIRIRSLSVSCEMQMALIRRDRNSGPRSLPKDLPSIAAVLFYVSELLLMQIACEVFTYSRGLKRYSPRGIGWQLKRIRCDLAMVILRCVWYQASRAAAARARSVKSRRPVTSEIGGSRRLGQRRLRSVGRGEAESRRGIETLALWIVLAECSTHDWSNVAN